MLGQNILWVCLGAKYDILKVVTITGTVCSICNAFIEKFLFEDFLIAFLISIALVESVNEIKSMKEKNSHTQEECEKAIEDAVKKHFAT